jgi:hypothetical protein
VRIIDTKTRKGNKMAKQGTRGSGTAKVVWTSYWDEPMTSEAKRLLSQLTRVRENLVAGKGDEDKHYEMLILEDHIEEGLYNEGIDTNHFACPCTTHCNRARVFTLSNGQKFRVVERVGA